MATLKPELRAILDKYGIDPRDKSQVWDCHGVLVLYHKAYEVIAAKEGITFDMPMVLEANGIGKSVALCVRGHMGDRSEWSVGEAAPSNCKNSYPYAMAEKRAKDRVIGKLVGLAEYVYSEAEADEFTHDRKAVENGHADPKPDLPVRNDRPAPSEDDWETLGNDIIAEAMSMKTVTAVNRVLADHKDDLAKMQTAAPKILAAVKERITLYRSTLSQAPHGKDAA